MSLKLSLLGVPSVHRERTKKAVASTANHPCAIQIVPCQPGLVLIGTKIAALALRALNLVLVFTCASQIQKIQKMSVENKCLQFSTAVGLLCMVRSCPKHQNFDWFPCYMAHKCRSLPVPCCRSASEKTFQVDKPGTTLTTQNRKIKDF